jgi:pantothenate kinase
MKIIAIGGEPGAGKSTLMKKFMEFGKWEEKYDSFKLVPYLQQGSCYILGKYEEAQVFSGTDRMSMAVQPEAMKFLASLPQDSVVLYEGDRLFTSSFLEDCSEKYDLSILYLSTDKEVRTQRYKDRGSEQNETWLAGRETKIANILTNMTLMFVIESFKNNTLEEQKIIIDRIMEIVNG